MARYRKITPQPSGPQLASGDIQAFEKRWDLKLPNDYKEWLLECNGGVPEHPVIHTTKDDAVVASLFHLDPSGFNGIDSELRRLGRSDGQVPVALEGGGGIILISVESGRLFLISSNHELMPVSESWTAFLELFSISEKTICTADELLDQIVRDADAVALDRLLNAGGNIDHRHSSGETMLQLAVLTRRTDSLELLLSRGASLAGAIHTASKMGMIPMIDWLLARGSSLDELNEKGLRPEDVASMPFVQQYLMKRRGMPSTNAG